MKTSACDEQLPETVFFTSALPALEPIATKKYLLILDIISSCTSRVLV